MNATTVSNPIRDIPYAPENGASGLGDLYLPARGGPAPVVLGIHGGGWTAGTRYNWAGVAEFLRSQLGFAVFNIEYRLAPASPWPACGEDCIRAAQWLFSGSFRERAGFSPERIWICGGSSGGHLALWTLVNLPADRVAGCISISSIGDPVPDFPPHGYRYRALFGPDVDESFLPALDPRTKIAPGQAPLLCIHATGDKVVPIASHRAFADAYRAAGNPCEFFEYPEDIHEGLEGHCIWIPGSDPHRLIPELEGRIAGFIGSVTPVVFPR